METIHGGLDFEINAPYLMYTHGNSEVGASRTADLGFF
jgi:hypothetical protein